MLKNQKIDNKELNEFFGKKDINLNLCFFTFLPFPLEDLEDLDLEELEEGLHDASHKGQGRDSEDLKFELNSHDLKFLKKNGLTF